MDSVSKYGFLNAKIRAKIGLLHSSDLAENLISSPSLVEAIALFKDTKHEALYDIYEKTGDLQLVELELIKEEVNLFKFYLNNLEPKTANFVRVLSEKIEVENIKNIIRVWYSGLYLKHQITFRTAYIHKDKIVHDIDYVKIINSLTYEEVVSCFKNTPYEKSFSSFDSAFLVKNGVFDLELAIDHVWFARINDSMKYLSKEDREVANKIFLIDMDLKNLLMLIRYGYYHNLKLTELIKVFIPFGKVYDQIKRELNKNTLTFDNAKEIVRKNYPKISEKFNMLEEKKNLTSSHLDLGYSALSIESYLAQRRKQEYNKILAGDPFTIGIILTYTHLFREESKMIRAILSAKYYNLSEDEIRRGLN